MPQHAPHPDDRSHERLDEADVREFRPWRLLGVLAVVLALLAGVAVLVDALVLGW